MLLSFPSLSSYPRTPPVAWLPPAAGSRSPPRPPAAQHLPASACAASHPAPGGLRARRGHRPPPCALRTPACVRARRRPPASCSLPEDKVGEIARRSRGEPIHPLFASAQLGSLSSPAHRLLHSRSRPPCSSSAATRRRAAPEHRTHRFPRQEGLGRPHPLPLPNPRWVAAHPHL